MTPELAVTLALSASGIFILLLTYERTRGVRFARIIRSAFDSLIENSSSSLQEHFPQVNKRFFRLLFHYVVHQALSLLLWITRRLELSLRTIARLNRRKAREEAREPDQHLRKIAEHKEETALSAEEREERKAAALRGTVK